MKLKKLIERFEAAKKKLDPILARDKSSIYIYQEVEESNKNRLFIGDGFGYSGNNRLFWRYGMSGHDVLATQENILESVKYYVDKKANMKKALKLITGKLEEAVRVYNIA